MDLDTRTVVRLAPNRLRVSVPGRRLRSRSIALTLWPAIRGLRSRDDPLDRRDQILEMEWLAQHRGEPGRNSTLARGPLCLGRIENVGGEHHRGDRPRSAAHIGSGGPGLGIPDRLGAVEQDAIRLDTINGSAHGRVGQVIKQTSYPSSPRIAATTSRTPSSSSMTRTRIGLDFRASSMVWAAR